MFDGIILGILTWLSFILTFNHLPKIIKKILLINTLVADLLGATIAFILLSGISQSIISVVGSITTGLLINFTLIIYKKNRK